MPDSYGQSQSNNPNALKISHDLYSFEKATFAGFLLSSIFYGVVIVLSFQCMTALFNPTHRRGGPIRWGLVSYTAVMFLIATVLTGMGLNTESASYINNREFPGFEDALPPGPLGYQSLIRPKVSSLSVDLMYLLNNWLAEGFLLYHCFTVYSMNLWVIAFPCFMYLGSLVMGIMFVYQISAASAAQTSVPVTFALPYYLLSIALNILLTLMIVIWLILRSRSIRTAMGTTGSGGLSKAIATMFIESCALYSASSLLVIGPWATGSHIAGTFLSILTQTQVIAPLLIIQRAADKSALTSNTVISRHVSSFRAGS